MRIISLVPSATEMLCALGLAEQIVGISHRCDSPTYIADRPRLTHSVLGENLPSAEIHRRVQESMTSQSRLYELDSELMVKLRPDLIVTQDQCSVCAVGKSDVEGSIKFSGCQARVVVLRAARFGELMDDICRLGAATGRDAEAAALIKRMRLRINELRRRTAQAVRPRVFCLSWFDPLMAASHWMTEMVDLAGGLDDLGTEGRASLPLSSARLAAYDPEVIVLMPCDFGLKRTIREWQDPAVQLMCRDLTAVRNGRVYAVKGSLFHRPGPCLIDGVEMLANVLHPLRVRHAYSTEVICKVA